MTSMSTEARQATIMVVDDTPANLQLLDQMLVKQGFRVKTFPVGRLVLRAAARTPPDLFLLDIMMPEMDGYEVCRRLKADPALREIPVLFISALADPADKINAFAVGGVDYVTKPFQEEEVFARIATHLRLHRQQIEIAAQKKAVQQSYDQLQALEKQRDQLVHMIIHDMRSPLQGIFMGAEIIEAELRQSGNEALVEVVGPLLVAGRKLRDMISTLLDISRMEAGAMPVDLQDCDLRTIVDRALESLGALARGAPVQYTPPVEPASVRCDPEITRRMIQNLVANAIQHTDKDGHIQISIQTMPDTVTLIVRDSGPGIPPEDHQRIFEKFAIATDKGKRKQGSTGLGLPFCKLAADAQKGQIGVESEIGKGSTFWFTLPADS